MRRVRVGDIVVVMEPCWMGCRICEPFIGETALVVMEYTGSNTVKLLFRDVLSRTRFERRLLYVTGLTS